MKQSASVTVIVPVLNAEHRIAATLESLFSQTIENLEIIVINDGSTDQSTKVLRKLEKENSNLRVIDLPKNCGVYQARAVGIRHAASPWIGFLDADDYARPDMFRCLKESGEKHASDIVICGSDLVTMERKPIGPKVLFQHEEIELTSAFERFCSLDFGTGALWNKLYRCDLIRLHAEKELPWRQDIGEDTLLNLGCFLDASCVAIVPVQLHEYVQHTEGATKAASEAYLFTLMLRAYAASIVLYQDRGREVLKLVDRLYAKQLAYPCYKVESLEELGPYEGLLEEALQVVVRHNPLGFAKILNDALQSSGHANYRGLWHQVGGLLKGLGRD